jgi:hypothetical protein
MDLGVIIALIVIFGHISNWLNWRFLNYRITHLMYYLGAFVHESSHAILCLVTGAKIYQFDVFSAQPHVTHGRPRLPIIGNLFISSAPIFGGLLFIFLVDHYVLGGYFALSFAGSGWRDALFGPLHILAQMRPLQWQSWVIALILLNAGAMLGPSFQDIKNVWVAVIILFFIRWPYLAGIGLAALSLIIVNIAVQIILILGTKTCKSIFA